MDMAGMKWARDAYEKSALDVGDAMCVYVHSGKVTDEDGQKGIGAQVFLPPLKEIAESGDDERIGEAIDNIIERTAGIAQCTAKACLIACSKLQGSMGLSEKQFAVLATATVSRIIDAFDLPPDLMADVASGANTGDGD